MDTVKDIIDKTRKFKEKWSIVDVEHYQKEKELFKTEYKFEDVLCIDVKQQTSINVFDVFLDRIIKVKDVFIAPFIVFHKSYVVIFMHIC